MRVRDLEIAMVLAREMKAAAARSVDASLRVEQIQEVFGVASLDPSERARIQTALQMAGLEPRPSLLDAEPGTAIRFELAGEQAAPKPEQGPEEQVPEQPAPEQPAAEQPAAEERAEFPTVGAFARSTLERAKRRFSGEHGPAETNGGGVPPVTATAEHAEVDDPGAAPPEPPIAPHDTATPTDFGASTDTVEHPLADPLDFDEPPAPPQEPGSVVEETIDDEPHAPEPPVDEEVLADEAPPDEEVLAEEPPPDEDVLAEEPPDDEVPALAEEFLHGEALHEEPLTHEPLHDEPLDEEPLPDRFEAEQPVAHEAPPPFAVPAAPEPAGSPRVEDVLAALLPATAIPVLVTAIAGWRFGLPFVALSVIGAGLLIGRRLEGEPRRGLVSSIRSSTAARAAIKATLLLSVVSAVAAVLIASVENGTSHTKSSSGTKPAAAPPAKPKSGGRATARPPARHTRPAPSAISAKPRHHRTQPASPAPSSTQGLVRVPPTAPKATTTTPTPKGTQGGGTTATPGH